MAQLEITDLTKPQEKQVFMAPARIFIRFSADGSNPEIA